MLSPNRPRSTSPQRDRSARLRDPGPPRRRRGNGLRTLARFLTPALFAALCVSANTAHAAGFFEQFKKDLEGVIGGIIRNEKNKTPDTSTGTIENKPQEPVQAPPQQPGYTGTDSPRYERAWVMEIQGRLAQLGYDPDPADGNYSDGTGKAIEKYQWDMGLPVNGLPTPSVMESLRTAWQSPPPAQPAPAPAAPAPATTPSFATATQPAVQKTQIELTFEAQDRLNQLGYNAGPADGMYGKKTASAVKAFQSDNGLGVDGRVTSNLIAALRDAQSGGGLVAPTPTGQIAVAPAAPSPDLETLLTGTSEAAPIPVAAAEKQKPSPDPRFLPYLTGEVPMLMEVKFNPGVLDDDQYLFEIARILYGNEWNKIKGNAFELRRQKETYKERIAEKAREAPTLYRSVSKNRVPKYDFDSQGFQFGNSGFAGYITARAAVGSLYLVLAKRVESGIFVPVSPERAEELVYGKNKPINSVHLYFEQAIKFVGISKVVDTDKLARLGVSRYLLHGTALLGERQSIRVYTNAEETKPPWVPDYGSGFKLSGLLYEVPLSQFIDNEDYEKIVNANRKDSTPKPDAVAAFKLLPEAIQNRIIDEATKYHSECTSSTLNRIYHDCDCVMDEFIKIRTIQGPEGAGHGLYKDALNRCLAPDAIAKHQYRKCVEAEGGKTITKKEDIEAFCGCYRDAMIEKIITPQNPGAPSMDYLSLLHRESYRECGYMEYRGKAKVAAP